MLIQRNSQIPKQSSDVISQKEITFLSNCNQQIAKNNFNEFEAFDKPGNAKASLARNNLGNGKIKRKKFCKKLTQDFDSEANLELEMLEELRFGENELEFEDFEFEKESQFLDLDFAFSVIKEIRTPGEAAGVVGMNRIRFFTNHRKVKHFS